MMREPAFLFTAAALLDNYLDSYEKFRSLPAPERSFVLRAWLLAPLAAPLLARHQAHACVQWIERLTPWVPRSHAGRVDTERGDELVAAAFSRHPLARGERCLPRALVQFALHRLDGDDVELVIGVRKDDESIAAHAWVAQRGAAHERGELIPLVRPEARA